MSLCAENLNSSLKQFQKFNYFFQNKTSLVIDNNIIPRMNISMSKNTESIYITKFSYHNNTKNNNNIWSDTLNIINN